MAFKLPAGSWVLLAEVVAVKGSGMAIEFNCELRFPGKATAEAALGLPGRGLRNLTLQTPVKLAKASVGRVWCSLFPSKPSPTGVRQVQVIALRAHKITYGKPL